jgi:hypothetical protein
LLVGVRRVPEADVTERRLAVEVVDAYRAGRRQAGLDPVPALVLEVERDLRARFSDTRVGPSRSPSSRTRAPNSATILGRLPASLGAKVKPGGVCSAQRANCSSAGKR